MLDFRYRGVCEHHLQRQRAAQAVVVVDNVDIIDFVHVFGLQAHLLDTLGHRPVFVDHNHLGAHQAAGGVLVIFQQVYDVAGLLNVVDVRYDFVALFFVELLYQVNGVVGVEVVNLLGDFLGRHVLDKFQTLVLVEFHQHVGGGVLVEQLEEVFRLLGVELLEELGYIGRVQVCQLGTRGLAVVGRSRCR